MLGFVDVDGDGSAFLRGDGDAAQDELPQLRHDERSEQARGLGAEEAFVEAHDEDPGVREQVGEVEGGMGLVEHGPHAGAEQKLAQPGHDGADGGGLLAGALLVVLRPEALQGRVLDAGGHLPPVRGVGQECGEDGEAGVGGVGQGEERGVQGVRGEGPERCREQPTEQVEHGLRHQRATLLGIGLIEPGEGVDPGGAAGERVDDGDVAGAVFGDEAEDGLGEVTFRVDHHNRATRLDVGLDEVEEQGALPRPGRPVDMGVAECVVHGDADRGSCPRRGGHGETPLARRGIGLRRCNARRVAARKPRKVAVPDRPCQQRQELLGGETERLPQRDEPGVEVGRVLGGEGDLHTAGLQGTDRRQQTVDQETPPHGRGAGDADAHHGAEPVLGELVLHPGMHTALGRLRPCEQRLPERSTRIGTGRREKLRRQGAPEDDLEDEDIVFPDSAGQGREHRPQRLRPGIEGEIQIPPTRLEATGPLHLTTWRRRGRDDGPRQEPAQRRERGGQVGRVRAEQIPGGARLGADLPHQTAS